MSARSVVPIRSHCRAIAAGGRLHARRRRVTLQDCARDAGRARLRRPARGRRRRTARNSDPWLVSHRTVITEMRPRVLVLNFQNGVSADSARQTASGRSPPSPRARATTATPTPRAPPFLRYEIAKVVDLTDATPPPGWPNPSSTLLPTAPTGEFDLLGAVLVAVRRSSTASPIRRRRRASLSLCELFEQGLINEVWIQDGEAGRAPRAAQPRAQAELRRHRDRRPRQLRAQRRRRRHAWTTSSAASPSASRTSTPRAGPAAISRCAAGRSNRCGRRCRRCAPTRCAFLNRDFDTRFGVRFDGWADICDQAGTHCVDYPTPTSARGTYADGTPWSIIAVPAGVRQHDVSAQRDRGAATSTTHDAVDSRCEHFGLRDGPDGNDAYEPYTRHEGRRAGPGVPGLRRRLADLLAPEHPGPREPRRERRRHADEELVAAALLLTTSRGASIVCASPPSARPTEPYRLLGPGHTWTGK